MANTKISALTSATTPLAGTEVLPIVQSSTTTKVAVNDMLSVTSWTSPAVDSNGNIFLRATDAFAAGVGTQIGLGGKYNTISYYPFGAVSGRKENATGNNVAGYLSLLTTTAGGTLTERWRVDSTGNFVQKVAGYGINFTANTPAAGMTSQLLNWYEEGTWTPAQGSGLTVIGAFSSTGKYTRIGRNLTISGTVTGATSVALAAAGIITTNLPFTVGTAGHGNITNAALTSFAAIICTSTNVTSAGAIAATGTLTFSATYFV